MQSKVLLNKAEKKKRIEDAAFTLFTQIDDFSKITIDQIVKKAQVAKGTFYLYFHDKVQLVNSMIIDKGSSILEEAMEEAMQANIHDPIDRFLYLVDYIITYFKKNPLVLNVIKKDLSWSILHRELKSERYPQLQKMVSQFGMYLMSLGYSEQEAYQLLFMMIELISSICYSCISLKQVDTIDDMKPMLFQSLRNMMKPVE